MDGQVTREGIMRDLEAMKRVGIGEGYIGIISGQAGTPVGVPSKAFTEEWWGHLEHAIREGGRLGVDINRYVSRPLGGNTTLTREVSAGDWIVLRAAMTRTGTQNGPAPAEATGREVDKMNRVPLKAHFDAFVGVLLQRIPAADRRGPKHVVADSYEMGPQTWTDGFAQDFRQRYGYDPLPWLLVLAGRIVGTADQSDRFLWDLRRLVAERVARDYVGGLRDLCQEHGLKMWLENYGHWGVPRGVSPVRRGQRRDRWRVLGGGRSRVDRVPRRVVGRAHLRQASRVGRGIHHGRLPGGRQDAGVVVAGFRRDRAAGSL